MFLSYSKSKWRWQRCDYSDASYFRKERIFRCSPNRFVLISGKWSARMSGGSRSQEWRVVCDDDEEMTIQRWFSRREQNSAHLNSPSEKSKGNKNGASLDQPKDSRKPEADGSRSTRGGAVCGILSTRQTGTTGPTPKGSPLSYPTLSSAGAAKKVQFSEDDIIQVMSPQPRGTPFVKPGTYIRQDI